MSEQSIPTIIKEAAGSHAKNTVCDPDKTNNLILLNEHDRCVEDFIAGALSPEAKEYWQKEQGGVRWVKASDRLPSNRAYCFIKIGEAMGVAYYHEGLGLFIETPGGRYRCDNVFWLDESGAGHEQEKDGWISAKKRCESAEKILLLLGIHKDFKLDSSGENDNLNIAITDWQNTINK